MPEGSTTGTALLEIEDLHAFYGESHALHGVSLHVRKGEVVTLLGRNGAGKTTTLRSIMGIVSKRTGSIRLRGQELIGMAQHKIPRLGIGYWWALILAPLVVGLIGVALEKTMLSRLYKLDHLYGLLLTFGLALIIEGMFRHWYGVSGQPYPIPKELAGGYNLGFMFLPTYRAWVVTASVVVCFGTWFVIERTKLGAYLRAATENPVLVQAFGINVPVMITATYGVGVALAGLAGVLAAPIYQVNPLMGSNLIIVVFAVVVIGGMGSILGAVLAGFMLGILEGFTKVFYPEASNIVIFVVMAVVLLIKPAGLFGREK
jgi:branched-chain amino acid transport system permease protein